MSGEFRYSFRETLLVVPDELRKRLSLGVRGLPATRMLRDELAAIVRPAL